MFLLLLVLMLVLMLGIGRLKSEIRIRHCFEIAGLPRRIYFWTLPVAVFGSSDTNWIRWGHLKCAR